MKKRTLQAIRALKERKPANIIEVVRLLEPDKLKQAQELLLAPKASEAEASEAEASEHENE